jgi:hypothetical protein
MLLKTPILAATPCRFDFRLEMPQSGGSGVAAFRHLHLLRQRLRGWSREAQF